MMFKTMILTLSVATFSIHQASAHPFVESAFEPAGTLQAPQVAETSLPGIVVDQDTVTNNLETRIENDFQKFLNQKLASQERELTKVFDDRSPPSRFSCTLTCEPDLGG